MKHRTTRLVTVGIWVLVGCTSEMSGGIRNVVGIGEVAADPADSELDLMAVPNPFSDLPVEPQRGHPYAVAISRNGATAFVALRGSELVPGSTVVVVDVRRRRVMERIPVGPRPVAIGLDPTGGFAVVLSQLSRHATVIDVGSAAVIGRLDVGYYAERVVFTPDGSLMLVTNRASDELQEWRLSRSGSTVNVTAGRRIPCGVNPGAIALSPDGRKVYVADSGGLGLRVIDLASFAEVAFIGMNAPVFDLQTMGSFVAATTLNDTSGLPCESDSDYPGEEGDGIFEHITDRTCSRGFADIQNEIAFVDPITDLVAVRYTSDSAEISEADREGDHPPAMQKVVGALPFGIAVVDDQRAYVSMGASFEVSEMVLDGSRPPLPPTMEMPRTWPTGFAPRGIGVSADGETVVIANMLGESVSILDTASGQISEVPIVESGAPFPASDAEVGELFFFTSKYSTDGDQSCSHCHPDGESDGKSWGVDVVRGYGRRATLPVRNLRATTPLLVEGVFNQNDFSLEIEAMAFRPDFHDSSYALQVQRRDTFFRENSLALFGRDVGFQEMVLRLGTFLVAEPRLLPNPFPADTPEVERGRQLYFDARVGCALCHPSPSFASPQVFEGTITMARFDRTQQALDPDSSVKFLQNAEDGFFNANSLRGLWDRRGALLHDGRATAARETILTPESPCLSRGERGFNEFGGIVDTHGAISRLSCDRVDDLIAFLMTIE